MKFIGDKIKELCFKYSIDYYGQDDLRGALICAIQSLGFTQLEALEELIFMIKYESDISQEELNKVLNNNTLIEKNKRGDAISPNVKTKMKGGLN